MSSAQKATTGDCLTAKALASRLSIGPTRLRSILRAEYPRQSKGKKWEIPIALAKQVEKTYKAKVKAREEKPQDQINNESKSG